MQRAALRATRRHQPIGLAVLSEPKQAHGGRRPWARRTTSSAVNATSSAAAASATSGAAATATTSSAPSSASTTGTASKARTGDADPSTSSVACARHCAGWASLATAETSEHGADDDGGDHGDHRVRLGGGPVQPSSTTRPSPATISS